MEMTEMVDGHRKYGSQGGTIPLSSSPLSSPCCRSTQTWLQVESPPRLFWNDQQMEGAEELGQCHDRARASEMPSGRFYEELFCTSQTSIPLIGALMPSSGQQSDVVKHGYLGKLERSHRRYFVLRTGSHTGPSRLEWYKTQEKFTAMEKSSGKAVLFGPSKQGVIYLRCCIGVSRSGSSRKGHAVALYDKDQTMVLVVEDLQEQEEWYVSIKTLMEEERKDEEHGERFDEEDDGYCTLPPAAFFKEVWPVAVKSRGLGRSKSLAGEIRLCLTATSLILVRLGTCSDLPSVTIPLLSVRRFGHLDGSFFLELGRSAPNGPGEIWLDAKDQAQHIHEVVRDTVRALRVLPDFSRSPTSNHNQLQNLLASKRSRPKYRDKPVHVRSLGSHFAFPPRNPEIQTSSMPCYPEPCTPDKTEPETILCVSSDLSPHGSVSETDNYMEMKRDHHLPEEKRKKSDCTAFTEDHSGAVACMMGHFEPGEKKGPGYMMMSTQVSQSSYARPQQDYVTMVSPRKRMWPACSSSSSLQTSFNSSTSDECSPLHQSQHQTNEHPLPQDDARQEQTFTQSGGPTTHAKDAYPLRGNADGSGTTIPFATSGPCYSRPVQASPNSDTRRSNRLQIVPDQPAVRRYRLSSCLPSCLQPED